MLNRCFVVGLGGSGTSTVRFLQQSLWRHLREQKIDSWPDAWRLLAIDVKSNQQPHDSSVKRITFTDDVRAFHSLTINDTNYDLLRADLDDSRDMRDAIDSWAPWMGQASDIPLSDGAGQFRAVGRAVAIAEIDSIRDALEAAFPTPDDNQGLRELAQRLHTPIGDDDEIRTIMIVVSSLAGGAGAGLFLDVCDLLRSLAPAYSADPEKVLGLVFAPDLYAETLDPAKVPRVQANALASISELLASALTKGGAPAGIEAVLARAGGLDVPERRGPKIAMVVGAKNLDGRNPTTRVPGGADERRVAYYESAGHTLATWFTSPSIQQDLLETYLANPPEQSPSRTGLNPESRFILSAAGFAAVGLGNAELLEYSAQRLARRAAENLTRGPEDLERVTDLVTTHRAVFIERSGLSELGFEKNQVLDRLRGGPAEGSPQSRRIQNLVEAAKKSKWRPNDFRVVAREWIESLERWIHDDGEAVRKRQMEAYLEAAVGWSSEVPVRLAALTEEFAGAFGFEVAKMLLLELKTNVYDAANSLAAEAAELNQARTTELPFIGRSFGANMTKSRKTKFKYEPKGPTGRAVERAKDLIWKGTEGDLRSLACDLLSDVGSGVIGPLIDAIEDATRQLRIDVNGPIKHWPDHKSVPSHLAPMPTKRLLFDYRDRDTGFKARFDTAIHALYRDSGSSVSEASDWAAGEVARGLSTPDQHIAAWGGGPGGDPVKGRMIEIDPAETWYPKVLADQRIGSRSPARFGTRSAGEDLVRRARAWIQGTGGTLKQEVDQNLVDVLEASPELIDTFIELLREAMELSQPLIFVRTPAMTKTHRKKRPEVAVAMTELPFGVGSRAATKVSRFLEDHGVEVEAVAVGEGLKPSQVSISSFLWPPVDLPAMTSLVAPIAEKVDIASADQAEWKRFFDRKRSRRLDGFVPVSNAVLQGMVRGFFVAEALGLIDHREARSPAWADTCSVFHLGDDKTYAFPSPMLHAQPAEGALLPALLESLPLALVEFGMGSGVEGVAAVKPYEYLYTLGVPDREGEELAGAFKRWLVEGSGDAHRNWLTRQKTYRARHQLDDGRWRVPINELVKASSADAAERVDHMVRYFQDRLAWMKKRVFTDVRTGPGPGADEIRGSIENALNGLTAAVRELRINRG